MTRSITSISGGSATLSGGCPKCGGQMIINSRYVECAERFCEFTERLTDPGEWEAIKLQRKGATP